MNEPNVKLRSIWTSDAFLTNVHLISSVGEGEVEVVRETYERAVANVPISKDKHYWRRYIYLWINYAVYEELDAQDIARTREVKLKQLYLPSGRHAFFPDLHFPN